MCSQLAGTGCFPEFLVQYVYVFKCFIIVLLYRFIYTLSTPSLTNFCLFLKNIFNQVLNIAEHEYLVK
jgi:hypothetical protein